MKEVAIKDVKYRIGKLSAMKQMLILKRLATILGAIQGLMNSYNSEKPEDSLDSIGNAITSLPDESVTFIVNSCLDVCSKHEAGGGWAPLAVNGKLMFENLDLLTMLALVAHTLVENLKGFFQDLPSIAKTGVMAGKK